MKIVDTNTPGFLDVLYDEWINKLKDSQVSNGEPCLSLQLAYICELYLVIW